MYAEMFKKVILLELLVICIVKGIIQDDDFMSTKFSTVNAKNDVDIFDVIWENKTFEKIVNDRLGLSLGQVSDNIKELAISLKCRENKEISLLLQDSEDIIKKGLEITDHLQKLGVQCKFLTMKFNASETSNGLNAIKTNANKDKQYENTNFLNFYKGQATFYGILKASLSLPRNTSIILITNQRVLDEELGQLALNEIKNKNIKLYVIWTGKVNSGEKLLQEVSTLSGGKFMIDYKSIEDKININDIKDLTNTELVFVKYNNKGYKRFNFIVKDKVTALYIIVSGYLKHVYLLSPQEEKINLLDPKQVLNFSNNSYINLELSSLQLKLNAPNAGMWLLEIDENEIQSEYNNYNVTIFVQNEPSETPFPFSQNSLADLAETKIQNLIKYFEQNETSNKDGEKTKNIYIKNVEILSNNIPPSPFYIEISEQTDFKGTNFSRLSYVNSVHGITKKDPISVEITANSNLIVTPGQTSNIYFEVTNNRDQSIMLHFQANDEKSFLSYLIPRYVYLGSGQTTIVTLVIYVRPGIPDNTMNTITFTVLGQDYAKKSVIMTVGGTAIKDDINPRVWHKYTSDCTDVFLASCESGTWTIEVTGQDLESGLLSLTTNPIGLYVPNGFTSGTKEQVVGYYSGTCCSPDLQLTAVDINRNYRTYTANAYRSELSVGAISAIILGIIILIIIIAAIIVFVIRRRRRQKLSIDLPSYRNHRSQTRT